MSFEYQQIIVGKEGITAKIVADSISESGKRITTFELEYPRWILAELNTHRCLVGSTDLWFDLPSGNTKSKRRVHKISIKDFYENWNGLKSKNSNFKQYDLSKIDSESVYLAKDLALLVGMSSPSNLRGACRNGKVIVQNPEKKRTDDFLIKGSDFIESYEKPTLCSNNISSRLRNMNLRMYNEADKKVESTKITDIWKVGVKKTYLITTENGLQIQATDDHPFLTTKGWKELKDLTKEDFVLTNKVGREEYNNPIKYKKIGDTWTCKWNKNVLPKLEARQEHLCYNCHQKKRLEVHHIIPVHIDQTKAFDEDNVIAVCKECHYNVYHKKQGWQVGSSLMCLPDKVKEVSYVGEEEVYDLAVESDFHNFIANGFVVHNCFSRNSMSSRAIPVSKQIQQIIENPATPVFWGLNQSGMSAKEEHSNTDACKSAWKTIAEEYAAFADVLKEQNLHKQIVNRLLEPFQRMKTVLTATEFDNFFKLRLAPDAQPEIQELARCMKEAMDKNIPEILKEGEWHTPYVEHFRGSNGDTELIYIVDNVGVSLEDALSVSTSCCAQVSYRSIDNSYNKAMDVYTKLGLNTEHAHLSPTEHQGTPIPENMWTAYGCNMIYWAEGITHVDKDCNLWSGNFDGWIQHRQLIELK